MLIMRNSICLTTALVLSLLSSLATAQTATNIICTSCVGPTDIATNAVTASEIAANAVTTEEIADGTVRSVDIANANVTSAKIANGTVALVDLSPALQAFLGSAIANITTYGAFNSGVGAAGVSCPSDRIPVSASCACDDQNGARNYGVLFDCEVVGAGAVAGCFAEAGTFNPNLPAPLAGVVAVCLGATSADGTPWVPLSTALTDGTKFVSSSSTTSEVEAQWIAEQQTAYEAALIKVQKKQSAHSRILQPQR
jgi:hypothetical protein